MMRDCWYGDDRDLVKWGTVVLIASRHEIQEVLQVPFDSVSVAPQLNVGGALEPVPDTVWRHFRDLDLVGALGEKVGVQIAVVSEKLERGGRKAYLATVISRLAASGGKRRLVLLDPDNGLEPKRASSKHVLVREVMEVWAGLEKGDVLTLYQHRYRDARWLCKTRLKLEEALRTPVSVAMGHYFAPDVALLFAEKP
jgi:hypothetical protein